MDKKSQEFFDSIIAKDPLTLTAEEAGFLFARRSYLTDEQREIYKLVLVSPVVRDSVDQSFEAVEQKKTRPELMAMAKSMGLPINRNMTGPQLQALIDDANAVREFELEDKQIAEEEAAKVEETPADEVEEEPREGHVGNFSQAKQENE